MKYNDKQRQSRLFNREKSNFASKEMHKAMCSQCKKECEVPFKPAQGRAVYCQDCFKSR